MTSQGITVFEYDRIAREVIGTSGAKSVPIRVFAWLEDQCIKQSETGDEKKRGSAWCKLSQHAGLRVVQITGHAGLIQSPCGFQIEVLPKIGRVTSREEEARRLFLRMVRCLPDLGMPRVGNANLATGKMHLLEVFIREFLNVVENLVKRGVRGDYIGRQANLSALRGRLLISRHIVENVVRRDRFLAEFDEFSQDRAENRIIHTALRLVTKLCRSQENQQRSRVLEFVFGDISLSSDVERDFRRIRIDRGMEHYRSALAWAQLILRSESPVLSAGGHVAPSLLFPMEKVFEAYVNKHLARQIQSRFRLEPQVQKRHLVKHKNGSWFLLKPDFLLFEGDTPRLLLDAKWKILQESDTGKKYQLSQADFYQLYAYGQNYMDGAGDLVLIYPKTDTFTNPLPEFTFNKSAPNGMRLWVLPFCLDTDRLILPEPPMQFGGRALFNDFSRHEVAHRI